MPGRGRSKAWWRRYHGARRGGRLSKASAARIASRGASKAGRKRMGRKAARTRRRRR
jgi:hypothetical protein